MKSPARFGNGNAPVLAAIALLLTGSAVAQQATTGTQADREQEERCRGAVHRQFDFWLGTWDVRSEAGDLLGRNEITLVAGGCALLENWHGAGGGHGMSLNTWDGALDRWTQRWVGEGSTLWLEGGLEEGKMVLSGTRSTPRGDVLDRITWTPLPEGRLSQAWEVSTDGGKSWRAVFLGYYSAVAKQGNAAAPGAAGGDAAR